MINYFLFEIESDICFYFPISFCFVSFFLFMLARKKKERKINSY